MHDITERLVKNRILTQKRAYEIWSKAIMRRKEFTFDDCRRMVEQYAKTKRRDERAAIIVELVGIHFTNKFNAVDIAEILYGYERSVAVEKARARIDELEKSYNDNLKAADILRKCVSQVLPKGWKVTFKGGSYSVNMEIEPAKRRPFSFVAIDGEGNAYAFLKMILLVRPMLKTKGIKFNFDTLQEIEKVWSMGESKIAYGARGMSGKAMIESEKKSYRDYFADYKLPDEIKATILDCLQESIAGVKYGVGSDNEGNSYNGLTHKPIPEKGLWVGVAKDA